MNIDEEAEAVGGSHNWLREGRYLCQIAGMEEVFNSKSGNHGVQFILQATEGKTKQALWLKGNCLWTWQVFAKDCGVDDDTRHDMPLEYNEANLAQLTQSLGDEKKAKAQCQVVVGNWARLEGIFMHRKVGAIVEDSPPKNGKVYGRVASLFELTPEELTKVAETIATDDDDIPF